MRICILYRRTSNKLSLMTAIKKSIFALVVLLLSINVTAQQTIGLFKNTTESFNGYTLFAPIKSNITYLINNCGEKVHSWTSQHEPGLSCYLLENGVLLRTGKIAGVGGGSGILEMIDWDGNIIWDYALSQSIGKQHHDVEMLPNGNILILATESITRAQVVQAGSSTNLSAIKSEIIVEIEPDLVAGGGSIVWEWRAWDHLIQNTDNSKVNYGIVSENPQRIDINFLNHIKDDWLHINGIAYNANFDQIIMSVHNFSEFWIIDHSTTTMESANPTGGTFEKGGNILYRWGNPQAYDRGSASDQKLFLQHHTHWIPESLPGAGKIIMFNNQAGNYTNQQYSSVGTVELPVDENGFYTYNSDGAFLPTDFDWSYQASTPSNFYSNIISGVQRLENGNTLICQGVGGRFFELNENNEIVWEYINPVNEDGSGTQNIAITDNNVFRATRYAPSYSGFDSKTLTALGYIESGSTFTCELNPVGISEPISLSDKLVIYPNPMEENVWIRRLENTTGDLTIEFYNMGGQRFISKILKSGNNSIEINVSELNSGVYVIRISNETKVWTEKIIKSN